MTIRSDIESILTSNDIAFSSQSDHIDVIGRNLRIYPVEDIYAARSGYKDDHGGVPKTFYQNISMTNEAQGIKTIWVKPQEYIPGTPKREIINSYILCSAGKVGHRFNGRNTYVKEVSNASIREFLVNNSFYAYRSSAVCLGLFLRKDVGEYKKDTMVMCYTFGYPFFAGRHNAYDLEVIRAATLVNCQVMGGASKLFQHFVKHYPIVKVGNRLVHWRNMVYYVDYDHNNGKSLPHLGFTFKKYAGPGFMNVITATGEVQHRQPHIHKEICARMSRGEIISVYNAGVKVYEYTKTDEQFRLETEAAKTSTIDAFVV